MTIPSEVWREEFAKRFRPLWNIAFPKNETVTMPVEIVDWVSALDIIEAFITKVQQEAYEEGKKDGFIQELNTVSDAEKLKYMGFYEEGKKAGIKYFADVIQKKIKEGTVCQYEAATILAGIEADCSFPELINLSTGDEEGE